MGEGSSRQCCESSKVQVLAPSIACVRTARIRANPESRPGTLGLITLDAKQPEKPSDRNGHARFDAAGSGNRFTVRLAAISHAEWQKRGEGRSGCCWTCNRHITEELS